MTTPLLVHHLGLQPYLPIWIAMRDFTQQRTPETPSELWLMEHPPVFTQGQAGRPRHLICPGDIPVIQTDRGGQVTYHGPGQLVAYPLLNLRVIGLGVKSLIQRLELALIELLASLGIEAETRSAAPGVYVAGAKIGSIGLRIRHSCCYHGISLNVSPDLTPFERINPCGYPDLAMTSLEQLGDTTPMAEIETRLTNCLCQQLGYTAVIEPNKTPGHE